MQGGFFMPERSEKMNSITIIKNGDTEKIQKAKGLTKRFECAVCGCVFDATNDTSGLDSKAFETCTTENGSIYYKSQCPQCFSEVR